MSHFRTTCAAPGWNSGHTTGYSVPCGGAKLSVFRVVSQSPWTMRRGDHDGRLFPSQEEARAFLLSRGYSQPYFSPHAAFKRIHRKALARIMARAKAAVLVARDGRDVVDVAKRARAEVVEIGGDLLGSLAWSNGVHSMARRLRPGLVWNADPIRDPHSYPTPAEFVPSYERWRHGGWYVTNVRYPSGGCGCVSNNYPDRKWRIACDERANRPTFRTRDAAARAEYALVMAIRMSQS